MEENNVDQIQWDDDNLPTVCHLCDATTQIPEAFFHEKRSYHTARKAICPACYSELQLRSHQSDLYLIAGYAIAGVFLVVVFPEKPIGAVLLNLFLFYVASAVSLLPHEMGHALLAKGLGFRVFAISVGYGRLLGKSSWFGIPVEFKHLPFGGVTVFAPSAKKNVRTLTFLCILAGPLVDLLVIGICLLFIPLENVLDFERLFFRVSPLEILILANVFLLLINLWPHDIETPMGVIPNDGKQLIQLLTLKNDWIDESLAARYLMEAHQHSQNGDYRKARNWIDEGLKKYPCHRDLLNSKGLFAMENQQFEEALDCLKTLLDREDVSELERAVLLNNIAYTICLLGDQGRLEEADRYSAEAITSLGSFPAIKGARGTVLLKLGRFEESIPLLLEAMEGNEEAKDKCHNAAFLAIAEAQIGNPEKARQYLAAAKRLDPSCFLIDLASREIAQA